VGEGERKGGKREVELVGDRPRDEDDEGVQCWNKTKILLNVNLDARHGREGEGNTVISKDKRGRVKGEGGRESNTRRVSMKWRGRMERNRLYYVQ
jgi:hypothetical protein